MCYSTDSTGHIHLSGKASHHGSKTAVDYYNASFLDVSPSNFCYQIHWLSYTFTHFSVAICQQASMWFWNMFIHECSLHPRISTCSVYSWHILHRFSLSLQRATLFQRPSLLLSLQWATPRVTSGSLCGNSALLPSCSWPTSWKGGR